MKNMKLLSVATVCMVTLLGVVAPSVGQAKPVGEKIKDWIDDFSESLKDGVDKLGDDAHAIQSYLDNYHWKGMIQDRASSGVATLKHLELNGHARATIVKPGEKIEADVNCDLDTSKWSALSLYRVVIGMKDVGPQAVIGNEWGPMAGRTREKFTLTAPDKPGFYQIRFRTVDALLKTSALDSWKDEKGDEPDGTTTIGILLVK